jgi:diphosphomevalonate decarboxylase
LTLKECFTETEVSFTPNQDLSVDLFLGDEAKPNFALKIKTYLESLTQDLPWLSQIGVRVKTTNTFPHGAGIASSASGLSAFALCLTDYLHSMKAQGSPALFEKHASHLARLASGSACRSIYSGFTTWGESDLLGSSDLYATPLAVHAEFNHMMDSVIVVSEKEKKVSSREGHSRLQNHFFAESRYNQARANFRDTVSALQSGDFQTVGSILESEAFSLHAMMMTSPEPYTLLKPNSLVVMEMVRVFREETKLPLYFTLDAGPNVHLIYPESYKHKIQTFIENELKSFAVTIIHDQAGEGPQKC